LWAATSWRPCPTSSAVAPRSQGPACGFIRTSSSPPRCWSSRPIRCSCSRPRRYETPGGVTETSTERRILFSPEIPGRRICRARPEWEVFVDVAARVRPAEAEKIRFASTRAIREEIARAVPLYAGIETLENAGDAIQWGGERLFADGHFATDDGKAHFCAVELPKRSRGVGLFAVSTRRGKQFNSMVQRDIDPLTGAARHDVFMSKKDARALEFSDGDPVRLRSETGEFRGDVKFAPIKPGNLEVHWPEGMPLLSGNAIDRESGEPDYNALVRVEPDADPERRPC
jgi:predicted molibdopterin-dependent oxidoreductase YjgC